VDRPLDEKARARTAILAGVVEDAPQGRGQTRRKVGVLEDQAGRFAAELEGDALETICGQPHHALAGIGGSGEGNLSHGGMRNESGPDDLAGSRQHVERTRWYSGLQGELAQSQGGE